MDRGASWAIVHWGCKESDTAERRSTSLIYKVVLVSGIQKNDSVTHNFFFRFLFSHIGYYKILNRVPCAIQ